MNEKGTRQEVIIVAPADHTYGFWVYCGRNKGPLRLVTPQTAYLIREAYRFKDDRRAMIALERMSEQPQTSVRLRDGKLVPYASAFVDHDADKLRLNWSLLLDL